ncbi:MAG: FtsX-like permease family protein [Verrucomicrobia bacterium]|nr:FtsX-like permease family protein [Verrucomicrobiota bacterium]
MNFVALRMLTGDRAKYLGLIFAIAFSTFLLENQTSIFAGILSRTASQIKDVPEASVWVMDPATQYFEETKPLKETDLLRVRGVEGVEFAVRLFKSNPVARTASGRFSQTVVMGLDDATLIGVPRTMVLGSWERLNEPDAVVIDRAGYALLFPGEPLELGRRLEMNDHQARIVGISEAKPPFVNFPVLHARYSVAVQFQGRERQQMSFVVGRPVPGLSAETLARRLEERTGLRARTSHEFSWDCILYYMKHTGIPVNFGITISIAVIVGLVVSGQTFYLFTVEHLRQFGALKAIGVSDRRLAGMIMLQAAMVGFIGFALGTGMAALFFEFFSRQLPTRGIILMWQNVVGVGVLMLLVVLAASLLSLRRVWVLEPAVVFRG